MSSDTLTLADAPRALHDMTGKNVSYSRVYQRVLDGVLPAERGSNTRWLVRREDLPTIAATLGLTKGS